MIKTVLDFTISDEVRKRDAIFIMCSLSKHKIGRQMAWAFFQENWVVFKNRYVSECEDWLRDIDLSKGF